MRKRAKGGWKARWSRAGGRAKESKAELIAFPPAAGGQRCTRLRWGRGGSSSSSPGMEAEQPLGAIAPVGSRQVRHAPLGAGVSCSDLL